MELNKEGYTTASIKQIMQSRYDIIVSKRGIQKIIKKYDTTVIKALILQLNYC